MDIKGKIKAAQRPERIVPVCLNLGLQDEYEQAERDLQAAQRAPRDSLASGSDVSAIAARMEGLRQQMEESTVTFQLRALTRPAWRDLLDAHQPRKDPATGEPVDADKWIGVNVSTFWEALVRASVVSPELDEDDWRTLLDEALTDRQFSDLSEAAWSLNRKDVDVPFSFAASMIQGSAPE